jgi:hypothetical protein
MSEQWKLPTPLPETPTDLVPPRANAYAIVQLLNVFTRVVKPDPSREGYKGLSGAELRVFLHLVSRMTWGNKVEESQISLAKELGISPQAYCRAVAALERYDIVRKRPLHKGQKAIYYLLMNPMLVQRFRSSQRGTVVSSYISLPKDKVLHPMRPIVAAEEKAAEAQTEAERSEFNGDVEIHLTPTAPNT